jgi:predicted nuclease of predicted toxin-antitoxin system
MRFLVDANLPRAILPVLRGAGYVVEFAKDVGLGAAPDEQIAARAKSTNAVLVTRDMDFANTLNYPPDYYSGLLVLRVPDDMIAVDIAAVVSRFVDQDRFRIRPALVSLS